MSEIHRLYQAIRKNVDDASNNYINTRPVLKAGDAVFDIKDMLILGAITGTDILLTGKTGSGSIVYARSAREKLRLLATRTLLTPGIPL